MNQNDPRDLFRGQYMDLNYAISSLIVKKDDPDLSQFQRHQPVYRHLIKKDGFHQADGYSLTKPKQGLFIRGEALSPAYYLHADKNSDFTVQLRYGIEHFFVNRETESRFRTPGTTFYAKVHVLPSGRPSVASVQIEKPSDL